MKIYGVDIDWINACIILVISVSVVISGWLMIISLFSVDYIWVKLW